MSSGLMLVLGASGNTGLPTIKILSSSGARVRAGVRDPSSDKLSGIRGLPGVEVVLADMSSPETLPAAFEGVTSVLIITPPDRERREMVKAAIAAASTARVSHVALVSVASAAAGPGTLFAEQFIEIEQALFDSGLDYTILRLYMFMENFMAYTETIKSMRKFFGPVDGSKPFTPIAVSDIAQCFAAVLLNPQTYSRQVLEIGGSPAVTYADIAQYFTDAIGEPVEYVQVDYDTALKSMLDMGIPDWQAFGICELNMLQDEGSPVMNLPPEKNDYTRVVGSPTSARAWIMDHVAMFM